MTTERTSQRANPFADVASDLPTFEPKKPGSKAPAVPTERVDAVAEATGFVSRQPRRKEERAEAKPDRAPTAEKAPAARAEIPYRYRTGRNQQMNVKATGEDIERFQRMARERGVPQGELLRLALDALERK